MKSGLRIFSILVLVVMMLSFVASVSAITGSIGNARMILRVDEGDSIEKYILVKNINDVSVDVELFASGDLEDHITIRDSEFTLSPNSEKRAYFDIDVAKDGTTETKINVKFAPSEGGNGVGLSSTVIVIAKDTNGNDDSNWFTGLFGGGSGGSGSDGGSGGLSGGSSGSGSDGSGGSDNGGSDGSGGVSVGNGGSDGGEDDVSETVVENVDSEKKPGISSNSKLLVPTFSTLVLFLVLLGLLVWSKKKMMIDKNEGKGDKSLGDDKNKGDNKRDDKKDKLKKNDKKDV